MGKHSKFKEDILRLRREGKKYKEIVELLNCSMGSISYYSLSDEESKARSFYIKKYKGEKNPGQKRNKDFVKVYLETHPCVDCGNSDLRVLDFDHVRGVKIGPICNAVKHGWPIQRLIEEIEKCEIRCSNCHRIVTHERRIEKQKKS